MPTSPTRPDKVNPLAASLSRSNLLAGNLFSVKANNEAKILPLDRIEINRQQPRRSFNAERLAELAEDIKLHGVLQPPIVRPLPQEGQAEAHYELVVGERRFRAAKMAGLHDIPVIIREYTDEEAGAVSLVENLQREDLDIEDEALYFKRLTDEYKLSTRQIGKLISKNHLYVYKRLKLLERMDLLEQVQSGKLNLNTALEMIRAEGEEPATSVSLGNTATARFPGKQSSPTRPTQPGWKKFYQFTSYLQQAVPKMQIKSEVEKESLKQTIEEIEAQLAELKKRLNE